VKADGLTLEVLRQLEIDKVLDSMQIQNPVHRTRLILELNKLSNLSEKRFESSKENSPDRDKILPLPTLLVKKHNTPPISSERRNYIFNRYRKGEVIGHGATAVVYKGMDQDTGQLVAIKEINLHDDSSDQHQKKDVALDKEAQILQRLQHPNIVGYLGVAMQNSYMYIYQEWVPGGSVASIIRAFGGALSPNVAAAYARHVATGLEYLHTNGIIHRDLKSANVLVTELGVAKLSDFGTSLIMLGIPSGRSTRDQMNGGARTFVGTPLFMAPEILRGESYGRKADVWSFGGFLYEMLTGSPPYKDIFRSLPELIAHAVSPTTQRLKPDLSNNLINNTNQTLLSQCFSFEPKDRPTAKQLLNHPALADAALHLTPRPMSFPSPTHTEKNQQHSPQTDNNKDILRSSAFFSTSSSSGTSPTEYADNQRIPFTYGRRRPLSPPEEPLVLESLNASYIQSKTPQKTTPSKAWRHRIAISAVSAANSIDDEIVAEIFKQSSSSQNCASVAKPKPINPYGRNAKLSSVIPTLSLGHPQQSVRTLRSKNDRS